MTAAEETLLESLIVDAQRLAESAREAAQEVDALLVELRQVRAP